MFNDDFGFQGGRYDNGFPSREVTVQRVVNIVNNRNPCRPQGFNFPDDDQWCNNGPQRYRNSPDYYWDNDFQDFRGFHGDDGSYIEPQYSHDDLRHHLSSRGRSGPYFRKRGGFNGNFSREDIEAFRASSGKMMKSRPREKKREKQYPERPAVPESQPKKTGPKTPSAAGAAAPEPGCKDKKCVPVQAAASSSSTQETAPAAVPRSSPSPAKDSAVGPVPTTSADVREPTPELNCEPGAAAAKDTTVVPSLTFRRTVEEPQSSKPAEEVPSAPPKTEGEPEPTPDEDFKARRAEAIRTKALEIEKVYRQDCETFCSVVKLLVDKEPSLETLLQAPLDKNLQEIKQQCLEELRQFVKELDEQCGSA